MKWDTTRTLYLLSFISISSLILFSYLSGILFLKNSKSSVMSNRLSDVRKCRFRCRLFVCVSFFLFCSRLKSVLYETDDLWEICFTGAEELSCLGRIVYSCLMNECSIKTVSLDLFILSTNLNISLLIYSTKLEVKLSWTLIFKLLYFFFPFFKTTY